MKNLLFIPCYRCEKQIPRVLESIKGLLYYFDEILVIDNVSPDKTREVAQSYIDQDPTLKSINVVTNPKNVGLGGTHKLAFQYALKEEFDHVIILHGDDQGNLSDMREELKIISQIPLEKFCFGARFHPGSKLKGYSAFRILGNLIFNGLSSVLTRRMIFDLGGSGLNIFPMKLLKHHPFLEYSNDLTFHVYLLLNALKLKQQIEFIPVSWREDDQISNVKLTSQSFKLLKILINSLNKQRLTVDSAAVFNSNPDEWIKS